MDQASRALDLTVPYRGQMGSIACSRSCIALSRSGLGHFDASVSTQVSLKLCVLGQCRSPSGNPRRVQVLDIMLYCPQNHSRYSMWDLIPLCI